MRAMKALNPGPRLAKVLVVEDEPTQAEVLMLLLTLEGFEVALASNGAEALVQVERLQPDLIITDYMMPIMNGGEMARHIRAATQHARLPIVMTSATRLLLTEQPVPHCEAFLPKPYVWDELVQIIKQLIPPSAPIK